MKEERILLFENPIDYEKLLKLEKKYELKIIATNYIITFINKPFTNI